MAFIVTEGCINCKYGDCVDVCPVDCFHEGPNFLVIDPEACIDCSVCVPECPTEAICDAADVPAGQERFVAINADLSKTWPLITAKPAAPLPEADRWAEVQEKFAQLLQAGSEVGSDGSSLGINRKHQSPDTANNA